MFSVLKGIVWVFTIIFISLVLYSQYWLPLFLLTSGLNIWKLCRIKSTFKKLSEGMVVVFSSALLCSFLQSDASLKRGWYRGFVVGQQAHFYSSRVTFIFDVRILPCLNINNSGSQLSNFSTFCTLIWVTPNFYIFTSCCQLYSLAEKPCMFTALWQPVRDTQHSHVYFFEVAMLCTAIIP